MTIVPLIGGIIILLSTITARFLFTPQKGYVNACKNFLNLGYIISQIVAFICGLSFSLLLPFGFIIFIIAFRYYLKFCLRENDEVSNICLNDVIVFYNDLPNSCNTAAILCNMDFTIHTANDYENNFYISEDFPKLNGQSILNFLTDEEIAKFNSSVQLIKENTALERFVLSDNKDKEYKIILNPVYTKNKKLVGYLIKHE